jgi:hypothetical protein
MSSHLTNDEVSSEHDYTIHRLTWSQFFTKLTSLLETRQQKGHGSIFLTQKRRAQSIFPYSRSTLTRPSDLRRLFRLQTYRLSSRRSRIPIITSTHPRSRDRWQLPNKGSQEVGKDQAEHGCTTRRPGDFLHSLRRSMQAGHASLEEERPQQEKEAEAGQEEGPGRQEMRQLYHVRC